MISVGLRAAGVVVILAAFLDLCSSTLVKRAASSADKFDDVKSCQDLPKVLEQLLAAGLVADGTPLKTSDLYAVHYPPGSNPTSKELFATIPSTAFVTSDNITGAIGGSKGWDIDAVIADEGYGEQAHASYSRQGGLPSFCRIGGMIETSSAGSKAQFEVWLPLADTPDNEDLRPSENLADLESVPDADAKADLHKRAALSAKASFKRACPTGWNKRLVFSVDGGLRGSVAYPEMKQTMSRYRVAVAGTNMGHFSAQNGTQWAPNNPEAWTDYGHRAVHLSTQVAQLAVSTFYDAKPAPKGNKDKLHAHQQGSELVFYSYFKGCSTGGRAGMAEVQKYPLDYDGVMAGCPAMDFNHLKAYQVHVNSYLANKQSAGYFSPAAYSLIHKAVLESCDAQDGVVDAVVSLPQQCKPDFAKLIGCTSLGSTSGKEGSASSAVKPIVPIVPTVGGTGPPSKDVKTPLFPRDLTPEPEQDLTKAPPAALIEPKEPSPAAEGSKPEGPTQRDPTAKTAADKEPSAKETSEKIITVKDATEPGTALKDTPAAVAPARTELFADSKAVKKEEAPKCLTDAQLETVKGIFTDYVVNGQLIRNAVLPGSEFGWNVTKAITGKSETSSSSWYHYEVLGDTVWDDKGFNVYKTLTPELIEEGEKKDPGGTITFNPDLSKFFDNGGKLLHYHGLADPLVPPDVSPRYYEMVKKTVGRNIADSYKLYLVPGMLHCRGGAGAFNFGGAGQADDSGNRPLRYDAKHDMFLALVDWVERGRAPSTLIGAAYKTELGGAPIKAKQNTTFADGVRNTRLLCPYPLAARVKRDKFYDTRDASAFECA